MRGRWRMEWLIWAEALAVVTLRTLWELYLLQVVLCFHDISMVIGSLEAVPYRRCGWISAKI